ncbi:MAG: TonB-dependent receptor [Bryobacteraceae bacterium]
MRRSAICLAAWLGFCTVLLAQRIDPPLKVETVVVTGYFDPVPLEEADRAVRSIDVKNLELISNTFADVLRLDSSLDLRQRAPGGLQSDLTIRGGSFGQTLILLNGLRLNDAQSGHHNLDVPVPLESIERVEVLKGSGSTRYGSDAVGGVVNFITRQPDASEIRLRTAIGNFGVNQQRGVLSFVRNTFTEQLSFSRDFSSGFQPDRDYRNLSLASNTHLRTRIGATDVTLANNDRPFGADQFYGNYNSWERTRSWFTSIRQTLGERTEASFAYRRHTDLFVLYRDRPEVFTNRHVVEGFQAALRRSDRLGGNSVLHYGAEGYRDSIDSNNLGRHQRSRGAGYLALDVRALKRFSFNAGVREEIYGWNQTQFSPSVSGGYWLSSTLKLRASVSRAFRLPSYTDLYYHDPANVGSPNLRPEKAWSYEGGLDWAIHGKWKGELSVFRRQETDGIDYVRYSASDIWRAANFQRIAFTGVEASVRRELRPGGLIELQYTGLNGAQSALAGAFSKYAFNYPIHSGLGGWQGYLPWQILARARFGVLQRFGRDPYGVIDLYAASTRGRIHPFLQLTNVTDTVYQEIFGVSMPGRAVLGGIEFKVFTSKK